MYKRYLHIILFFSIFLNVFISINVYAQTRTAKFFRIAFSRNIFSEVNPEDANAAVKVYAEVIRKKAEKIYGQKIEFESKIYNSVEEIRRAIQKNELDQINVTAHEYFELRDLLEFEMVLTGSPSNSKFQQYVLLVHNETAADKIANLRGMRLSIPKLDSYYLLDVWLSNLLTKNNFPAKEKFFHEIKYESRESKAILNVFFRSADCAIVRENVYKTVCEMNPQIIKSVKILDSSPELINSVTIHTKNSDPELTKIIINICSTLIKTPEGKNLLNIFKLSQIVDISEGDLTSTKNLLDEYNKSKKRSEKKK